MFQNMFRPNQEVRATEPIKVVSPTTPTTTSKNKNNNTSNHNNKGRKDPLNLWYRLLCRPEVYDPFVEAAPTFKKIDLHADVKSKTHKKKDRKHKMYAEEDTEANDNNYYYCDSASTVSTPTSATEGTSCTDSTTSHPSRTFVQEGSYAAVVRDVNPVNPFFIYDTRDNNQRHNGTKDSEDARLEVEVRRVELNEKKKLREKQKRLRQRRIRDEKKELERCLHPETGRQQSPPALGDTEENRIGSAENLLTEEGSLEEKMKDSFSSASVASTYIDDEHVDTITNGAVMFQSVKRCKPSKQTPVKGNSQRREQSKYPLQSRLYAERCILSAHAQQRIALLMLLESCYAYHWSVELELLQCYYFYLSPFFEYARGTTVPLHNEKANEEGALNLLDVVFYLIENDPQYANWKHIHANDNHKEGANYYNVVCENKKNFTLLRFDFDLKWRILFTAVRKCTRDPFLEDTSSSGGSPSLDDNTATNANNNNAVGSICFAATILHSMELFERVNTKKKAVQEIKSFLKQYFYMDANQGGQVRTEAIVAAYQSLQDNKKRETGKKGENNINDIPDLFLPADFVSAQNSDVRNVLYLRRREEKLNILREADEKLYCYALETLRQENARIKDPQHSDQTTSPTEVTADNGVFTPPSAIENIQQEKTDPQVGRKKSNTVHILSSDEEEDRHLESHKIINTGCFGFSFLSRFD